MKGGGNVKNLIEWLKGKKTYIIAVIVGVVGALNYLGIIIPEWIYALLAAIGLGTIRAAISKTEK